MKSPQVFGKYLLLERISVGGMAEIFIAKAFGVEGFERMLAIKKILPSMAEDLEFITMFIDEARISSQLNHANVVHIHELGKYDDAYYIAMEHVQGLDLRAIAELYRRERQAMPVPMAAYIISRVCEGLDYAHRAKDGRGQDLNIVHRDVSPQNVLVSFDGEVKIIDFGIAKAANRTQQTQVGILKGKFGYMSPEQALGKPIDRRSDLFAVGVILYELLTGDRLFVGESDFSVVEKVRNADIISPREMNPEIPKALEKVILKALARDQHDRYQWCSELQEDLNRFLISEGTIYSGKQLSHFMHEAFADDLQLEAERMERFASVERPDDLEDSNVAVSPRRRSSRQIPIVTAPAPRLTPSRGTPTGGAPARKPSDPAVPRARPPSVELARKPGPAPEELEAPPPHERTQIVDASHLQARAVAEQPTNVKTQHPPKGKVVIGDKAVHGPTVIGAAPESRSKPAARRNPPPINAPPSVVVDAGLGLDQAYDSAPDTGVHDLPQDTGAFAQPPEFADDEPRTQGVESYSFGEEPPEEEDEAPPPWPSLEGKGETVIGPAPTAPPEKKRVSSLAEESNRRRAALAAEQPSVIVGGARLEDADEATPTASDVGLSDPEQTAPLQ
ncbi:MAG: protein kinase, partial [Myxococcota bacterium]|nr:protein kinase [Myxococcota bacterium]